jgi:hypothetical protein
MLTALDKQILAAKQELQSELSTNTVDRKDDGGRNMEGCDKSIDNLTGMEEQAHTGSNSGPVEYSVPKEDTQIHRTDNNKFGIGEYVKGCDECVASGNKEHTFKCHILNL